MRCPPPALRCTLRSLIVAAVLLLGSLAAAQGSPPAPPEGQASGFRWLLWAEAQAAAGDAAAAMEGFREAIELSPLLADAHFGLGGAYLALGLNAEAALSFAVFEGLEPGRFEAAFNRALALLRAGRLEEGAGVLEGALSRMGEATPTAARAQSWSLWGATAEQLERFADAADGYREAWALEPGSPAHPLGLGRVLLALGDLSAAVPVVLQARALGAGAEAWWLLAEAYRRAEATEWSLWALERWVLEAQEGAYGWSLVGLARHGAGDPEGALRAFERVVELDPGGRVGWWNLAALRTAAADHAGAAAAYRVLLQLDPDDIGALHHLGWVLYVEGAVAEALEQWRRACELGHAPSCDAPYL